MTPHPTAPQGTPEIDALRSAASWMRHLSLTHGNRAEEWAARLEECADVFEADRRRLEATERAVAFYADLAPAPGGD
jgi:hypothetical protein